MIDQELRTLIASLAIEYSRRQVELETKLAETHAQLATKIVESHTQLEAKIVESHTQLEAKIVESHTQLEAKIVESHTQLEAKIVASHTQLEEQLAKTDAQLSKLSKLFGDVNNNRGEVAEEFFFRSLEKYPRIGTIKFDTVHRNLHGSKGNVHDEFDLVLINGGALALIEVKTKAHVKLVDDILQKKIPHLRILFPHFKNYKIYAGIASLVSYEDLINQTSEKGLFLLTQQGKHLEVTTTNMHSF